MNRQLFSKLMIMIIIAFAGAVFFPQGSTLAQEDRGVLVPAPYSPHGTLLDSTPTYKWSLVTGATIYQYQVWRGSTKLLDKSPDAEDVCGATTCEKSPAYTLGYNLYKWRVRAYKGGVWSAWSAYMEFNVSPAGFSNTFNNEMVGWALKTGKEYYKSATYVYTLGLAEKWSTIYRTGRQFTDFTYTVRMKRPAEYAPQYLVIRAGTALTVKGLWHPGYYFGYDNWGNAIIYKLDPISSMTTIHYDTSSAIVKKGWNTLQVKAIGWKFWYYINGTLIDYFTDTDFPRGYVGIASFRSSSTSQTFYVDSASLVVQVTPQ